MNNEIKELQESIIKIMNILDNTKDPVVRKRLIETIETETRRLEKVHRGNKNARNAVDVLDRCLMQIVEGTNEARKTRQDIQKLKIDVIDRYVKGND